MDAETLRALRLGMDRAVREVTGQDTPSLLAAAITPAVYLRSGDGESHLGGLPRGTFPWPTWEGDPMLFVLALRLAEVRSFDPDGTLPASGWLNVFLAREVVEGMSRPDACAVVHVPCEDQPESLPPAPGLIFPPVPLAFATGLHMVPQDSEFGSLEEERSAFREWAALGFETLDPEVEALREEDYLLGKQLYSNPVAQEGVHDLRAFVEDRWGEAGVALRALVTLRRDSGLWTELEGNAMMAVTVFVPTADLRTGDFSRVMVDAAVD